jgi:GT2 family glycosyltransferase
MFKKLKGVFNGMIKQTTNNMQQISASIVLYNPNINQLKDVINSYAPSERRYLFLIDNSLKQIEDEILNNEFIKYHFVGENIGFGAGHNIAIKMAIDLKVEYHILLNPDLVFEKEIIDELINFMNSDATIVEVMPKILYPNGEIQYLCKLLPTPFDLIFRRFFPKIKMLEKYNDRYILKATGYDKILNVPCLSGCFMFLRIDAIRKNNILFDERFFLYCEDFDFVRRLHMIGKTIYFPNVSVTHVHLQGSYKSKKLLFQHIKSAIKYFNKWGWFFDKDRKRINEAILYNITEMPNKYSCCPTAFKYAAQIEVTPYSTSYDGG